MKAKLPIDKAALLVQANAIEKAIQEAVRDALIVHKRLGHPIVVCEGEEIRWIPAEEIVVDDETATPIKP
jgi:hypothetical protein